MLFRSKDRSGIASYNAHSPVFSSPILVDLGRCIGNLSSSLCSLSVITLNITATCHEVLNNLMSSRRAARFRGKHLALLVHHEDTASSALGCLLQANCRDERLGRIAQQAVREVLLDLKRGVRFGAIVGKPKDTETGCGEGRVRVAKEADLSGTLTRVSSDPVE